MKTEHELTDEVEKQLRDGNWKYEKGKVIGEARPDFLVTTANGDQIVLEVKAWESNTANTARAIHQAQRYKELSKAGAALVVTAGGEALSMKSGAVIPTALLLTTLTSMANTLAQNKNPPQAQTSRPAPTRKVFASMPFAAQYDDTFLVAIAPASLTHSAIAERVDHNGSTGNVVTQIQSMKAAKVIVADLSDSRPNVLHEIGYAEALRKPVIQICSTPTNAMPFNVRNNQTIQYVIGQTAKLRRKLEIELQKVI